MFQIKTFDELRKHLVKQTIRRKVAVANAVDAHVIEAVVRAVHAGIVEAFLVGDAAVIKQLLQNESNLNHIFFVNIPDSREAAVEAVRMVHTGECDFLMKGLVNTDVILRAVLDKKNGLLPEGNILTFAGALSIPNYHKMLFFADPAVIPEPTLSQRVVEIKNVLTVARRFGVQRPKVALLHATEKPNPKIRFMDDYLKILDMARAGIFGDVLMDGPLDIFLALDKELGAVKKVNTPILGDADVLIFPDFASANCFYKGLVAFAGAEMAGVLQGVSAPVIFTSRSDSVQTKLNSICAACMMN